MYKLSALVPFPLQQLYAEIASKLLPKQKDLSSDPKALVLNPPCKTIHKEKEDVSGI